MAAFCGSEAVVPVASDLRSLPPTAMTPTTLCCAVRSLCHEHIKRPVTFRRVKMENVSGISVHVQLGVDSGGGFVPPSRVLYFR